MKRSGWRVATIPTLCSILVLPPTGSPALASSRGLSLVKLQPPAPKSKDANASSATTAPANTTPAGEAQPNPTIEVPAVCQSWSKDPAVLTPASEACNRAIADILRQAQVMDAKTESRVPKNGNELRAFSGGTGHTSTKTFQVSGKWKVIWESDSDFMAIALREVVGSTDKEIPLQNMKVAGKNSRDFQTSGTYYVDIEADGPWRVRVVETVEGFSYDYDVNATTTLSNPFPFPVNLEYSFGEGGVKTVKLSPGQERKVYGTAALMDFEEPQTLSDLADNFPSPEVYKITSASHLATNARIKAERQKKYGKQDPYAQDRQDATTELQRSAISDSNRAEEEEISSLEREARLSREADRDWVRRWSTAGVVSLLAGLGGGAALITVGAMRKKSAETKLKDTEDYVKEKGTSPLLQSALGRYANQVESGRQLITGGVILAVAGTLVGTGLFFVASRKPSKRMKRTSDAYTWRAAPYWSAREKSFGFSGQLRF